MGCAVHHPVRTGNGAGFCDGAQRRGQAGARPLPGRDGRVYAPQVADAVDLTDPRIVRALSHPLRARILKALDRDEASPVELARQLDAPLGTVSYHVKTLADLGLVKLVRTTPRRGALEHHYKSASRQKASAAAWDKLPAAARGEAARVACDALAKDLRAAAKGAAFERKGSTVHVSALQLDEQGWRKAVQAVRECNRQLEAINRDARKRDPEPADQIVANVAITLFETGAEKAAAPRRRKPAR